MTIRTFASEFRTPLLVLLGIVVYIPVYFLRLQTVSIIIALASIGIGSYELVTDTLHSLKNRQFALDYIAIMAILVSIITNEYIVGMVIALMIASGRNLEHYGVKSAKNSLTKLVDRIPKNVILWEKNKAGSTISAEKVAVGQDILVRKGEVIPLDGTLMSQHAVTDESSLTGEPYPVEKVEGDIIRSGTINVGDIMVINVTKEAGQSTYKKIIALVEKAQNEKAPLVRLADRYSTIFTLITAVIAAFAYWLHPGLQSILAVLVVATPCPLILATPIALLAGMNAAARQRIIIKKLASLESLARVNAIIFDKTGTITLGKPKVIQFDAKTDSNKLLSAAAAIERNSLHPLAKAVVAYAEEQKAPVAHAKNVTEQIGKGISGTVQNKTYTLSKLESSEGMRIGMYQDKKLLATFHFADEVKQDSKEIVAKLLQQHISLSLYTGDKEKAAQEAVAALGENIAIKAECTPEDKQVGIQHLKKEGKTTAMVGDGINDAPALALADVGMVFSNEEQTAASEAADIVFLGGNFALVADSLFIAKRTIGIALQSIWWGIGLSILAMVFASVGLIPPLIGAILQEGIDVLVILNALRAAR